MRFEVVARPDLSAPVDGGLRGGPDSRSHSAEILGRQGPEGRGQLIDRSFDVGKSRARPGFFCFNYYAVDLILLSHYIVVSSI